MTQLEKLAILLGHNPEDDDLAYHIIDIIQTQFYGSERLDGIAVVERHIHNHPLILHYKICMLVIGHRLSEAFDIYQQYIFVLDDMMDDFAPLMYEDDQEFLS